MPRLLAAHPPWRQLLIVSIVLPVVVVAAVLAFAWPAARVGPRNLPVGVVGAASEQISQALDSARPGGFDVHLYPDVNTARTGIRNRDVYGAFVITPGHLNVLEAGAASPTVAQLLTTVGQQIAQHPATIGPDLAVTTTDVVPLPSSDPRGTVFSAGVLPLLICSVLLAVVVAAAVRFRPAWRQLLALTVVSAVTGAGAYLIEQTFLGALPHNGVADWAGLTLITLATSAATAGVIALVGLAGLGLVSALIIFVGNAFSGVSSAPELLPGMVKGIGQWLPPGAGANLLRSFAYFDGHGAGGHLAVLIAWTVLGFAAVVVGHHSPLHFAAYNRPEPVDDPDDPRPLIPSEASTSGASAQWRKAPQAG